MTALCGMIGTGGAPVHANDLAPCLDALGAFGDPADAGTWEGTAGRTPVTLGALGTDPGGRPSASQPVRSTDGRLTLVADALLDCRHDLVSALGHDRSDRLSDAELILAAYERWGERCLERLSGEFAFALVDGRRGGVLLARDQLGYRPIVVHERPGAISFATTALALADLPGVGHELDEQRVAEWLAFVMNSEGTFVRGAVLLAQGHAMWIDESGTRTRRYWELDPERIVDLGSPEAHAEALRAAFDDAVGRRLPGAGGVGVMVSGGLDSTSVAATAARLLAPGPVRTYTSVPPAGWSGPVSPNFDASEEHLVRDLASLHPGMQPTFVDRHEGSLFARHDAAFRAGAPPLRNPCNALWHSTIVARAAADGVETLLSGARGNLFFSADDPRWLVDLFRRGRLPTVLREVRATAAVGGLDPRKVARTLLWRELVPASILRRRRDRRGRIDPYTDLALRSAGTNADDVVRAHWKALDLEERTLSRHHAVLAVMAQGGGVAESTAVMQTLSGVRLADPTGDIRMLALCAEQPSWVRRRDGRTRAVVRDAMADRLPHSIAERTRRGSQLPDWLERMGAHRDEMAHELAAAREDETCRRLLDLDRIGAALDDWPDQQRQINRQREVNRTYRYAVLRGLMMAHYIRFFTDHARERRARSREVAA